ncbi:MAG: 50S ribosomal protein L9 [Lactobacillales bacterium]|jgi:large subunit ribosomal protein L9|nr:50S ribosomal protein L9 [Lactobacillales bacterium]
MKIVFIKDVKGKGKKGEIKEIASGYAQFLIKNGSAKVANNTALGELDGQKKAKEKHEAEILAEAQELKAFLEKEDTIVHFKDKPKADGSSIGAVSSIVLVKELEKQYGVKVDKHKLEMNHPIKSFGNSEVPVKLHKDVKSKIQLRVDEA